MKQVYVSKKNNTIYDNYNFNVKKRLMKLYSGMEGNSELLKQYDDIVTVQELGILEEVESPGAEGEGRNPPHHSVLRDDKTTTKVRIVFDASSGNRTKFKWMSSQRSSNHTHICRSILRGCSIKKDVLRNFAKFTGKRLW